MSENIFKSKKIYFLAIAFHFILGNLHAENIFTEKMHQEIQAAVQHIIQKYPPDEYDYIGIGRSASPIVGLLQLLYPEGAFNIPISSFRYGEKGHGELNKDLEGKLFNHFDKFLPKDFKGKKKKNLVIDFCSSSGASLIASKKYLEKYDKTASFIPLAILSSDNIDTEVHKYLQHENQSDTLILSSGSELFKGLAGEYFDEYSQYGQYFIERDLEKDPRKDENILYIKMQNEMMNQLENGQISKNPLKEYLSVHYRESLSFANFKEKLKNGNFHALISLSEIESQLAPHFSMPDIPDCEFYIASQLTLQEFKNLLDNMQNINEHLKIKYFEKYREKLNKLNISDLYINEIRNRQNRPSEEDVDFFNLNGVQDLDFFK